MDSNTVHIFGWHMGARTIAAVVELRNSAALGHLGAKNAIYDVVGGASVAVTPLRGIEAATLAARMAEWGFVTALEPPFAWGQGPNDVEDFDRAFPGEKGEARPHGALEADQRGVQNPVSGGF
jgi:hypothetical protein